MDWLLTCIYNVAASFIVWGGIENYALNDGYVILFYEHRVHIVHVAL